jgi:hypothetical protein
MLTFFCPHCWHRIAENAKQCLYCGFDLNKLDELSYDERLVMSLRHSISEYRITAARILGQHGAVIALPEFKRIVDMERDYYLLKEVLFALLSIPDPLSVELMKQATRHPSKLVSRLAQELLIRLEASHSQAP